MGVSRDERNIPSRNSVARLAPGQKALLVPFGALAKRHCGAAPVCFRAESYCAAYAHTGMSADEPAPCYQDKPKPPVNWWYAQPLEGAITDLVPKRDAERFDTALLSQAAAKAAVFFRAYLFLLPVNGSIYSFRLI